MKRNVLSLAINSVLATTLGLSVLPMSVQAQDGADKSIEEIVVTGSRIKRSNFDASAQVITMDRIDIDNLGVQSVSDALRSSPLNSLGSFNERSGSSSQSNATIDLRGLGSERTLVLVNNRRLTGSPNLGASTTNINMIPMVAIERGEILADGASTVYGSDAVAGVVNMTMRDSFEGIEFTVSHGDRTEDDGVERGYSFIGGGSGDRGKFVFAVEATERDPIFDADRDYTSAKTIDRNGDGNIEAYLETDGYSIYGASIAIYDPTTGYDQILASTSCSSDTPWLGVVDAAADWNGSTGTDTYCMYGYANASANKAGLDRLSTYFSGDYQITDQIEFFGSAIVSRVKSFGRYAPPAASWDNMPETHPDVPFDIAALITNGDITPGNYELTGYYRWTNVGTRDNEVTDIQYDFTAGLRGDINSNLSYEVHAQQSRYDSTEFGYYYLSDLGVDYVFSNGIDPFSEEGIRAMSSVTTQDNFTDMRKYYGHVQVGLGDLFGAGDTELLVGVEKADINYQNKYDRHSEGEFVGGSAGNSSDGERDIFAIFAETVMPIPGNVEVSFSARWDDYSDFGSEISPALGVNWRAMDGLHFRARISQSFRAPSLDQLYGPDTFSAEDVTDYVDCVATSVPIESCPSGQRDTYFQTNPDLEAETADALSVGVNYEFVENWAVDLGYWTVDIDNVISEPLPQDIVYAELAGTPLPVSGGNYTDRSGGRAVFYSTYINDGVLEVEGLDLRLNGLVESGFGNFTFDALVSKQLKYKEAAYYKGPTQDVSGFNLTPSLRAQLVLGWSFEGHAISFVSDYIGPHAEQDIVSVGTSTRLSASSADLDSWLTHTLSYSYDAEQYGMIKVGARNLTNEEPVFDKDGLYPSDHYDLYDQSGRTVFAEYTIKF